MPSALITRNADHQLVHCDNTYRFTLHGKTASTFVECLSNAVPPLRRVYTTLHDNFVVFS